MRHRQAQHAHADRTLKESLAFVLLTLCFAHLKHIVAELAVEVLYFFLHTESTETFLAFEAQVHLLLDELAAASTAVMDVR